MTQLDTFVLCGWLLLMVAFGLWMGRGQKGGADFMLGGRSIPTWAVLLSIVATETSTVTFLSIPGTAYTGDMRWIAIPMGYVLGRMLVVLFLLPGYFRGEIYTAYQILQDRFGSSTRRIASGLFLIARTLADGLRLFLTALALQEVAGVPLPYAVGALGVATVVYTCIGGMRAVVWADVVQFFVYMGGAGLAAWLIVDGTPGGFTGVMDAAEAADKLEWYRPGFSYSDPFAFGTAIVGGMFLSFGTHGADQLIVQRFLSARTQKSAAIALIGSGFVVLLQFLFFLLLGVALYVFYNGAEIPGDRVFARFIVDELPSGVRGLLLGAVFSAAMSTLSSSLNSSATAVVNDFVLPIRGGDPDSKATMRMARWFTVIFGGLQVLVALSGEAFPRSVVNNVMAIAGFTTGILLGLFFIALWVPRATGRHAQIGLVFTLLVLVGLRFGLPLLDPSSPPIAWPWFPVIGSLGTLLVGWIASRFSTVPRR